MHALIQIHNKAVQVEWTEAAESAMQKLETPLNVEMELYFSCLIRKKVRFGDKAHSQEFVPVNRLLGVAFRPVMTKACHVDSVTDAPPLSDFPIHNPAAFVPHWLKIDYQHGQWQGEFGLAERRF